MRNFQRRADVFTEGDWTVVAGINRNFDVAAQGKDREEAVTRFLLSVAATVFAHSDGDVTALSWLARIAKGELVILRIDFDFYAGSPLEPGLPVDTLAVTADFEIANSEWRFRAHENVTDKMLAFYQKPVE